jgi:hypothetical protein
MADVVVSGGAFSAMLLPGIELPRPGATLLNGISVANTIPFTTLP